MYISIWEETGTTQEEQAGSTNHYIYQPGSSRECIVLYLMWSLKVHVVPANQTLSR